jgi:hypothetical protein
MSKQCHRNCRIRREHLTPRTRAAKSPGQQLHRFRLADNNTKSTHLHCRSHFASHYGRRRGLYCGPFDPNTISTTADTPGMPAQPLNTVTPATGVPVVTQDFNSPKWIPVAAGSVSNPTEEQVSSLTNNLSIFAIYGNRDAMGKRVTERLTSLASAETLELDGGHPCYMDSPEDFVSAILRTMNVLAA